MKKIIIIGGGNMGYSIAGGIVKKGLTKKQNILFIEKNDQRTRFLRKSGYQAFQDLQSQIKKNKKDIEAVILAIKPNDFKEVLEKISSLTSTNTFLISIAAGIQIKKIESMLGRKYPIARVMPNAPCQIGEGMSALTYNKKVTKRQKQIVVRIFSATGKTIELNESKFNLITAISGSGPAYFCYLMESMINTGKKLGLDEKSATELVLQTAKGSSLLLEEKLLTPEALRNMVTSPGGTTYAAVETFRKFNFKEIIFKGIKAANDRGVELGKDN